MTNALTITRPDDWHLHLRDNEMLRSVVGYTAAQFGRAIVMPNLVPPVTTAEAAASYRQRILAAVPEDMDFTPLMTCYLTDSIDPADLRRGKEEGIFTAAKLYPQGATTNSDSGVSDVKAIYHILEAMEKMDLPLLIHGEVVDSDIDIFDREAVFLERTLAPLLKDFPGLRVVLEHITTAAAAQFVADGPANLGATITAHHLAVNRNAMLAGGIRPHYYCLPILKRERDRQALRKAATSGNPKYFLGTDSAPHLKGAKESSCGCAGCFTAPTAMELYAEVFDEENALDRLEGFASLHGPAFYKLPVNEGTLTLVRRTLTIPESVDVAGEPLIPWRAGETLAFTCE